MRFNITKKNSTKAERVVYEVLKDLGIPFKHRWIVAGHEIDFVIGNYAIEINGHEQNTRKNEILASNGFIPIHIHNSEVSVEYVKNLIQTII